MIYRLYEDIYGNKATVYHRTKISDLLNKVWDTGFQAGTGDFYGKGFYSTYDLKSQQRQEMQKYGQYIVKFYVSSLYNFISLDYSEFLKLPISKRLNDCDEQNFIDKQLESIGIDSMFDPAFYDYSSEMLKQLWNTFKKEFTNKVDGVIYTGENDGKCLLAYNTNIIVPYSYSRDEGKTFDDFVGDLKTLPKDMEDDKDIKNYRKTLSKSHEANATNFYGTKERFDIFEIVANNDIEKLKIYIKNKGNLNVTNKEGETPLIYLCHYKYVESDAKLMFKILIDAGVDINIQNYRGETALFWVAHWSNLDMLKLLIYKSVDLNIQNKDGETALLYACRSRSEKEIETIEILLKAGADVNIKNNNVNEVLRLAYKRGSWEIIELLKQHGAKE